MELDPEKLKTARQLKAMTQDELAKLAGMRQATISLLEAGRTIARMSTIRRLADALEIDPADVMSPAKEKSGHAEA